MRIACWITEGNHNNSEYTSIMIIAYLWQQLLGEQASMLRLYIHCLSCLILNLGFIDLQNQLSF